MLFSPFPGSISGFVRSSDGSFKQLLVQLGNDETLRSWQIQHQSELWQPAASAWGAILPKSMETDASTVVMEACAAGAGIAVMPSYISECDSRLKPLVDIKPLASVRFWLAYTERIRNTERSAPVLQWIRSCFDPSRHACFRELYVPPDLSPPDKIGRLFL